MQTMLNNVLATHYQVINAYSGTEGLLLFKEQHVDLVLLDRLLPGKSGDEVLVEIRQNSSVPIIMLTALDDSAEIAQILMKGANDYVTKPFNIDELQARIAVQLRSSVGDSHSELSYKQLTLLPNEYAVKNDQQVVTLKQKEFNILQLLFENPHMIFTKEQLYERIWSEPYFGDDNTINVHLSNLRNKLASLDDDQYIETIWGIGVRLA